MYLEKVYLVFFKKNRQAIIWNEGDSNGLPILIYVAREKRHEHNHHYKAGAMNVLVTKCFECNYYDIQILWNTLASHFNINFFIGQEFPE